MLFQDYAQQMARYAMWHRSVNRLRARVMRSIVCNHLHPGLWVRTTMAQPDAPTRQRLSRHQAAISVLKYVGAYPQGVLHAPSTMPWMMTVIRANPAARLGKYLPEKGHNARRWHHAVYLCRACPLPGRLWPSTIRQYYAYFFTLARTGMREGEALGLRWDDIQFGVSPDDPHRFIHVQRTYDSVHNRMNTPKNGKTRRVDMAKDLREGLLEWQAVLFRQGRHGWPEHAFPCGLCNRLRSPLGTAQALYVSTSAAVPWLDSEPPVSMISGTAMPLSCSMSCTRPSSTSLSSSGIPASRLPSIPTVIRARV